MNKTKKVKYFRKNRHNKHSKYGENKKNKTRKIQRGGVIKVTQSQIQAQAQARARAQQQFGVNLGFNPGVNMFEKPESEPVTTLSPTTTETENNDVRDAEKKKAALEENKLTEKPASPELLDAITNAENAAANMFPGTKEKTTNIIKENILNSIQVIIPTEISTIKGQINLNNEQSKILQARNAEIIKELLVNADLMKGANNNDDLLKLEGEKKRLDDEYRKNNLRMQEYTEQNLDLITRLGAAVGITFTPTGFPLDLNNTQQQSQQQKSNKQPPVTQAPIQRNVSPLRSGNAAAAKAAAERARQTGALRANTAPVAAAAPESKTAAAAPAMTAAAPGAPVAAALGAPGATPITTYNKPQVYRSDSAGQRARTAFRNTGKAFTQKIKGLAKGTAATVRQAFTRKSPAAAAEPSATAAAAEPPAAAAAAEPPAAEPSATAAAASVAPSRPLPPVPTRIPPAADQAAPTQLAEPPPPPAAEPSAPPTETTPLPTKGPPPPLRPRPFGNSFAPIAAVGSGGGGNNTRKNRGYIHEIKENRKQLFNKEMEIINSIRNFKHGHDDRGENIQKKFIKVIKRS